MWRSADAGVNCPRPRAPASPGSLTLRQPEVVAERGQSGFRATAGSLFSGLYVNCSCFAGAGLPRPHPTNPLQRSPFGQR